MVMCPIPMALVKGPGHIAAQVCRLGRLGRLGLPVREALGEDVGELPPQVVNGNLARRGRP